MQELSILPGDARADTRWLKRFLVLALTSLILIATLNIIVDPYATLRVGLVEPVVWNARQTRVALLRELEQPPELLILGSSRVMKVEPDYLKQLTGLDTFNAGVDKGMLEDSLAILRFVLDDLEPRRLKTVVLGIDISALDEKSVLNPGLLELPELASKLEDMSIETPELYKRYLDNLSFDKTAASLRTLRIAMFPETDRRKMSVDRLGFLTYIEDEKAIAAGTFDLAKRIGESKVTGYKDFVRLSPQRLACLDAIIAEAVENDLEIYIYIVPAHPDYVARLKAETPFKQRVDELCAHMKKHEGQTRVHFFNASEVEFFGGEAQYFFDGHHPRVENNRKIMDILFGKAR